MLVKLGGWGDSFVVEKSRYVNEAKYFMIIL